MSLKKAPPFIQWLALGIIGIVCIPALAITLPFTLRKQKRSYKKQYT